ncbi:hypothetical protein RF11_11674 [Thelohanellus kitauei]|uniref:Uncharacterized protein n=1 Tax=Thelohanellus kitauei TaxID=669202 RepID=A0A0C2ML55_THEKT|nr:hypothetical protein RF11_11674 [Thelohanellus kitauei]
MTVFGTNNKKSLRTLNQTGSSDAADEFFEASKIADIDLKKVSKISTDDLVSPECYRVTLSIRAFEGYRNSIEAHLKKKAVQKSVQHGYIYEKEYGDIAKSNEFYNLADDLRREHDIDHLCILTDHYMLGFGDDISKSLYENPEWVKENNPKFKDDVIQTIKYLEERNNKSFNASAINGSHKSEDA